MVSTQLAAASAIAANKKMRVTILQPIPTSRPSPASLPERGAAQPPYDVLEGPLSLVASVLKRRAHRAVPAGVDVFLE
jgi:hypothetical protein